MTADDDRVNYLSGEGTGGRLPAAERAGLDDVRALLADRSVWAEPPSGLEDAVVAAVSADASAGAPAAGRDVDRERRARMGRAGLLIGTAAAAVALAVVLGPWGDSAQPSLEASLGGTPLAPSATGYATFRSTDAGWRIELDATGLPRLDDGRFYQAWLRDGAGDLVAIGTFNEPDDVVLWAGVSPREFSTITVTEEAATDDSPSEDRRVLVGEILEP